MQINFLEDADGARLTKTFTPTECRPYPNVALFNSYKYDVASLEDMLYILEESSQRGRCLLKGDLNRELKSERRAGSTSPLTPTSFVVLDLDFDQGFDSIDHFLECIGLSDISYILHHSSSAGIRYKAGLRAHIIMLLNRPISPALLKSWLQHLNLNVEKLTDLCQLSATGYSLRWPLDVTTCQNDKLIYISDPNCEDVEDPMAGKRFELHLKTKASYDFPYKGKEFQKIGDQTEKVINDLRQAQGLPKRKAQYGTADYNGASVEYLKNPTRASVTSTRDGRGFTYVNLNGGDSWGYYFPTGSPEYLFNFKGEPVVRLRDVAPEYFDHINQTLESVVPEPVESIDGKKVWVFMENNSSIYYSARLLDDGVEIIDRKNRVKLNDWYASETGRELGVGDIPIWTMEFDPTRLDVVDFSKRWVNSFRPSKYLQQTYSIARPCPPIINQVLRSITVDDEAYEQMLHCLAHSFQTRLPWRTGWILRGTTGTGKGLLFNRILVPIFGAKQCEETTIRIFNQDHNGWIQNKLFVMIDECDVEMKDSSAVLAKTKHIITEPHIQLRRMNCDAVPIPNWTNMIIATNNRAPLKIESEDRRWNVAAAQEVALGFDEETVERIEDELDDFCAFLTHFEVDKKRVRTPLNSASKRELFEATENSVARFFRAANEGDLDYFIEMYFDVPKPDVFSFQHENFRMVLSRWAKEYRKGPVKIDNTELMRAYNFITAQRHPVAASKFGAIVRRNWRESQRIRDNGLQYRGWEVDFKVEEEGWVSRLLEIPLEDLKREQHKDDMKLKMSILEGGVGHILHSKITKPALKESNSN